MQIFIFSISVGILIALYKILPNKKFFPYFCILFCFVFCGAAYFNNKNAEQEKISQEKFADLQIDEQIKIHNLKVPEELDAEIKKVLAELIRKTQIYSDAQVKIISSVKNISNPKSVKNIADLNKKIKDITIRESPAGLFTANEISDIREKFIILEGEEQ